MRTLIQSSRKPLNDFERTPAQTIGDDVRPFDDRVVARELLDELAATNMTGDAP